MFDLIKLSNRYQSAVAGTAWPIHVQRIFFGFVTFCLVAPLVQTIYPVFGTTLVAPVEERRDASPFPSLHLHGARTAISPPGSISGSMTVSAFVIFSSGLKIRSITRYFARRRRSISVLMVGCSISIQPPT